MKNIIQNIHNAKLEVKIGNQSKNALIRKMSTGGVSLLFTKDFFFLQKYI